MKAYSRTPLLVPALLLALLFVSASGADLGPSLNQTVGSYYKSFSSSWGDYGTLSAYYRTGLFSPNGSGIPQEILQALPLALNSELRNEHYYPASDPKPLAVHGVITSFALQPLAADDWSRTLKCECRVILADARTDAIVEELLVRIDRTTVRHRREVANLIAEEIAHAVATRRS